jgi:nitrite reductase/ring-hydroxylating ferredoxin subunit
MPMADINRRDFIVTSAAALGACVSCPLHAAAGKGKKEPVDVGALSGFPKDGIYDRWAEEHALFVIRASGRLYAVSAMCTHKRFELVSKDGALKCPKHGSIFNTAGKPQKAPARKPLPRFGIRQDAQGHVIVDPSREFPEKHWKDPGSYISVK